MISNLGAITTISSHIASGTYDGCGIGGSSFKSDKEYITFISILSWVVILILGWIPLAPYIFNNFMDSCVTLWVTSMGVLLYSVITFILVIWIKELVNYKKSKKNMKNCGISSCAEKEISNNGDTLVSLDDVCKFLDEHLYTGTSIGDYDFGQEYIYSDFDNATDLIFALRKAMGE